MHALLMPLLHHSQNISLKKVGLSAGFRAAPSKPAPDGMETKFRFRAFHVNTSQMRPISKVHTEIHIHVKNMQTRSSLYVLQYLCPTEEGFSEFTELVIPKIDKIIQDVTPSDAPFQLFMLPCIPHIQKWKAHRKASN